MPLSWIVLVSKSLYNRANIITKYHIIFMREKLFEFILMIAKETYFSILGGGVHPFSLENSNHGC